MYHPGCLTDLMSAAAPRWQASITRDATNIFLSLKLCHLILKAQSIKYERKLCKCPCVPCRWRIPHPCNRVILLHMVGQLQHRSFRCIHQCTEILGYTLKKHYMCSADASFSPDPGAVRLLCITFKILGVLSICLNYCGCSKLLRIWPLTPLRCEGCPHRSGLWLSPVLLVPRISSIVKCRLAELSVLQWFLQLLLKQQNKITHSTYFL